MRARRAGPLVLLLALACEPAATPLDRSPGSAPVTLLATLSLGGGDAALQGLADGLGEAPLGARSVGELGEALAALPPGVLARADALAVALLDGDGGPLVAARLPAPSPEWSLETGGARGASRVRAARLAGSWSALWAPEAGGGVLALAPTDAGLEDALGWLGFAVLADVTPGFRAEVPARVPAAEAAPRLRALLEGTLREARADIARERRARAEAPAFGEPEALLRA
ncbi:MAG: hypothetical protein AAGH15_22950, partial [Myxococcota bacterium]